MVRLCFHFGFYGLILVLPFPRFFHHVPGGLHFLVFLWRACLAPCQFCLCVVSVCAPACGPPEVDEAVAEKLRPPSPSLPFTLLAVGLYNECPNVEKWCERNIPIYVSCCIVGSCYLHACTYVIECGARHASRNSLFVIAVQMCGLLLF